MVAACVVIAGSSVNVRSAVLSTTRNTTYDCECCESVMQMISMYCAVVAL